MVVEVGQAGHLHVVARLERHLGFGVEIERLPTASYQRQFKQVCQRPLTTQGQRAAAHAAHGLGEWHTQGVPVEVEFARFELVMLAMIRRGLSCDGVGRGFDITLSPMAADHIRPAIAIPLDLLNRSLSAERAPAAHAMSRLVLVPPGPAAQ